MDHYTKLMIIGWCLLVSSWVIPYVVKDKLNRRFVGLSLSAIAVGVFISAAIVQWT